MNPQEPQSAQSGTTPSADSDSVTDSESIAEQTSTSTTDDGQGSTKAQPEQRSRRDLIATAVIAGVVLVMLIGTWIFSTARQADLTTTEPLSESSALDAVPQSLSEAWRKPVEDLPLHLSQPLVQGPVVVFPTKQGVSGLNPQTGEVQWSYTRNFDLCSLTVAWGEAIPVFRGPAGCGQAIGLKANTGQYSHTRSAIASDDVVPVRSNDNVGIVSRNRVELWRNDLVRTIEYGYVEAPQEPNYQPHPNCTIHSALTRKKLLALVEFCPQEDNDNRSLARLLEAVPEDSRKPEIFQNFKLGAKSAEVVAIGQEAAVVYVGESSPHLDVLTKDGKVSSSIPVPEAPAIVRHAEDSPLPYVPVVADGPNHMFWWDGARLYAFTPGSMAKDFEVPDALGTGVVVNKHLLVPVSQGIAVVNTAGGAVERIIPVKRDSTVDSVSLALIGDMIIERRQTTDSAEIVALKAEGRAETAADADNKDDSQAPEAATS